LANRQIYGLDTFGRTNICQQPAEPLERIGMEGFEPWIHVFQIKGVGRGYARLYGKTSVEREWRDSHPPMIQRLRTNLNILQKNFRDPAPQAVSSSPANSSFHLWKLCIAGQLVTPSSQ